MDNCILALIISVLGWYGDHGRHYDCDGHSEQWTLVATRDVIRTHLHKKVQGHNS